MSNEKIGIIFINKGIQIQVKEDDTYFDKYVINFYKRTLNGKFDYKGNRLKRSVDVIFKTMNISTDKNRLRTLINNNFSYKFKLLDARLESNLFIHKGIVIKAKRVYYSSSDLTEEDSIWFPRFRTLKKIYKINKSKNGFY